MNIPPAAAISGGKWAGLRPVDVDLPSGREQATGRGASDQTGTPTMSARGIAAKVLHC